jgi:2-C-methyl-D-erythritol 2,4-cyclodiphosphate synthase
MTAFRVGFGYDVHQLQPGLPLVIGGVLIPHNKGALGHSDADVLTHAVMDALLGAAGLGDIGTHFSDTDPDLKGISSLILLERVVSLLHEHGYETGNVDATICLQTPRLAPHIPFMEAQLSKAMGIHPSRVSVKATTTEKLGFVGQELGVSAYAVVLIQGPAM